MHYSGGSEFTLKKHDINKVSLSVKYPIGYRTKNCKKQNTKVIDFERECGSDDKSWPLTVPFQLSVVVTENT